MKKIILRKPGAPKGPVIVRPAEETPQLKTKRIDKPEEQVISTTSTLDELQKPSRFKFYCVRCGQKLEAELDWAGMEVECTTCRKRITIPEPLGD